jgi:hypothetical protein
MPFRLSLKRLLDLGKLLSNRASSQLLRRAPKAQLRDIRILLYRIECFGVLDKQHHPLVKSIDIFLAHKSRMTTMSLLHE